MTFLKRAPAFLAYGQFGQIAILDGLLLAPFGATPLAAVGFAASVLAPFFIFATSLALALAPLVAREGGSERRAARLVECLRAQGAITAVSVVALLLLARGLDVFQQPADVTASARPHLLVMTLSLVPLVLLAALREWANALGRPAAPAACAMIAITVKLGLGLCLVRGVGPLPAFGMLGASISTIVAYGAATLLLLVDLARNGLFAGVRRALLAPSVSGGDVLRQGVPVSLQQLAEVGALYVTAILAGWLGAGAAAAHTVAVNVINGAGLMSLALAQRTAVEVVGAAHQGGAGVVATSTRCAARTFFITALIAVPVVSWHEALFATIPSTSALALLVAITLLADGVQTTLGGALRGLADARFVAMAISGTWFVFCVPLSYALAFELRLGISGIWASFAATALLSVIVLGLRLRHLTRPASSRAPTAFEVAS